MRLGLTVLALSVDRVDLRGRINGVVALEDLRAACALRPTGEWPTVVGEALQGLALSLETPVDVTDPVAVRPLLRVRVYSEGAVLADDVVSRPLCEGLVEVLVADVGGAVRPLPPRVAASIGEPAALFELGRRQVLEAGLLALSTLDLDGVRLTALEGPSPFAATHLHWLPSYIDVPEAGLLVALPTRHLVLCAPILARGDVLAAAQVLLANADRLWRAGPGALAPDLWWWRPEGMVLLPGTPTSLSPPTDFLQVLDALPG